MKTRVNAVAGYLAVASLLSGSAFAFAPEFNTDVFPTVIITDRTTGAAPAPFDGTNGPAATSNLFRFDGALDLGASIQDLGNASSLSDVKFVFNEFDVSDPADLVPNTVGVLTIGGVEALDDLPVKADFSGANAGTAGVLDFRNIDFSPGTALDYPDAIGDLTGWDLNVSGAQKRVVRLEIDTVDSTTPPASGRTSKTFEVWTTNEGDLGDRLSTEGVSSDPFVPVVPDPGNFNGWQVGFTTNEILGILNGPSNGAGNPLFTSTGIGGFTSTPALTLVNNNLGPAAPNGTTSLGLSSTNAQIGLTSWQLAPGPSVTAGNIYRFSLDLTSSASTRGAAIFALVGDVFGALSYQAFNAEITAIPAGTTRLFPYLGSTVNGPVNVYHYAKVDGNAFIQVQLIDQSNTAGNDFTLNGYDVSVISRADALAGATVIRNLGGSVAALASGEPAITPPTGETALPAPGGTTPGVSTFVDAQGLNTQMPSNVTISGGKVNFQMGPTPTPEHWDFIDFGFASTDGLFIDTMDTGLNLDPNKLYLVDIYATTNQPGQAHPKLIVSVGMDILAFNHGAFEVGGSLNPEFNLAAAPRVYTTLVNPGLTANAEARANLNIRLLKTTNGAIPNLTVTVHRIVVYETDIDPQL